ncbi:MAG: DUF2779 domain-containing protein [Calditrichaeota bacterium]|nr:MAG: DUF2779 domain-containing protein [Calditrichota bacterium]
MIKITKQLFLNTISCSTLGWHTKKNKEQGEELSIDAQFRIAEGNQIGELARKIFPNGKLISELRSETASLETKEVMQNSDIKHIFEATFIHENFVTKADVLRRNENGTWDLIEVKSSVKDDKKFIDDIAYTTMIIENCGVKIDKTFLYLVSKDFRLGMPLEKLFNPIEHTEEVKQKVQEFKAVADSVVKVLETENKPLNPIEFKCKKCDFFADCSGQEIKEHIFALPRISQKKYSELQNLGVDLIKDVPDSYKLTENQKIVRDSTKSNKVLIQSGLTQSLEQITFPAYYLDFETTKTAFPVFPETAPHTQILTQFSIHKCSSLGKVENHFDYLVETDKDYREELAKRLIQALGGEGSIVVYTNFEKTQINGLIKRFPHFTVELENIISRLVDLEKIIEKGIYHPKFYGSFSIKKTLPAFVPEMTYEGMAIGNGLDAMCIFAKMLQGTFPVDKIEQTRKDLLVYCKQDTLAMVKLHEAIYNLVNP